MYQENFIPLEPEQIKKLNKVGLAITFKCSHSYVNKVLRLQKSPKAPKAISILETAREIIKTLEKQGKAEEERIEAQNK